MAREKKVEIGAVNITMHPHSPEKYIQLLRHVSKQKLTSRINQNTAGLIAGVRYYERSKWNSQVVTGDLYRFGNIDWTSEWFNTKTSQTAEEDDLKGVKIPNHLKPNASRFSYLFFSQSHLLFYESYYDGNSIGHTTVQKLLRGIFDHESVLEKYGEIDVTTMPSREKLNQALKIDRMDRLFMSINRPNPDDLSAAERRVMRRLQAQNVKRHEHELIAIPGTGIEPDETTKELAKIASRNGVVTVKGKDRACLLYTSPSPRDQRGSRMPSSA